MDDRAPGLDMPNGIAANVDYQQKFVKAPAYQPGPCNHAAEKVDPAKVMRQVNHAKA